MTRKDQKHWLGTPKPYIKPKEKPKPKLKWYKKKVNVSFMVTQIIAFSIIMFVWGFNFCYALYSWWWG